MSTDRREFLKLSTAAGAALGLGLGSRGAASGSEPAASPAVAPSRGGVASRAKTALVLGGTGFIGPYEVNSLLDMGLEVTIFNRGSRPGMFPGVEELIGDRNGDFESLRGRSWDICIDNSTARPDWVTSAGEFLRDSVGLFYYVSSRSAYASHATVPMTASEPTFTFETAGLDRATADITSLPYGLAKAESEREVMRIFGERYAIFRPGLIVGPDDPTYRFTYWPVRIRQGGEVLCPGDGTDTVQVIDVRDLGDFMALSAAAGHTGQFNLVGPQTPRPVAEMVYGIRAVTTAETVFTWVDTDFLTERQIRGYAELPVWRPPVEGAQGFAKFDLSNEVAHGLTFRSLADTTEATLESYFNTPEEERPPRRAALTREREAEVLAEWHASRSM
ncbi:MAG: NAD-dependent epimerase/dehydratase family protein [Gemmatimonadota bacterium]|nr:NAD-dependent epimerase/dehydratase family protein [Gemmatimonadota bacterium]